MSATDKTFQVPAEVITGVRRYYQAIDVLHDELTAKEIPALYFIKRVKENILKKENKIQNIV